ncbi:hypothetical protein [Paenibacillus sp. DCT19]|uniref:hypothetical protein n=1 Tax=Paenibacillus sp. DCT19 TaxID=2211212 RepID=UPI0013E3AD2E|nr:hypothetical protein [Paenibacillus sp. DCT19]
MKKPKWKVTLDHIREFLLVCGFIMAAYGIWMIYPPAMYIICGIVLMWVGMPNQKGGD